MKQAAVLFMLCASLSLSAKPDFLSQQKKYERVKTAFSEKEAVIAENLHKNGFATDDAHILFVAYKAEELLELYAKKKSDTIYKLIATYDICESSGVLGPKRKQGDGQVPEGFYSINIFNHASNYYLSLGINYPNQSDRKKSKASDLGGAIMIHGSCVTIGCLPMTDDKIKEIYVYAVLARSNGQNDIPVYIFPFRMEDFNFQVYKKRYGHNKMLVDFWANLKVGYDKFILEKSALQVSVDKSGDYLFK
jgi:murein L,D-transpeptidase YafK